MSGPAGTGPGPVWPGDDAAPAPDWPPSALEGPHAQGHAGHETTAHQGRLATGGHRHGWMMVACCVPMIAIAIALVATGVAGAGFILVALACTAMMATMHLGMGHGGRGGGHGPGEN